MIEELTVAEAMRGPDGTAVVVQVDLPVRISYGGSPSIEIGTISSAEELPEFLRAAADEIERQRREKAGGRKRSRARV